MPPNHQSADTRHESSAQLVSSAVSQISTLARDELSLAKTELLTKGKQFGLGGGLVGVAGILAFYGIGLSLALILAALALVWPVWLSLLSVTLAVFAAAAVAGLAGKRKIAGATPPMPTDTIASVQKDVRTVTDAIREGRRP